MPGTYNGTDFGRFGDPNSTSAMFAAQREQEAQAARNIAAWVMSGGSGGGAGNQQVSTGGAVPTGGPARVVPAVAGQGPGNQVVASVGRLTSSGRAGGGMPSGWLTMGGVGMNLLGNRVMKTTDMKKETVTPITVSGATMPIDRSTSDAAVWQQRYGDGELADTLAFIVVGGSDLFQGGKELLGVAQSSVDLPKLGQMASGTWDKLRAGEPGAATGKAAQQGVFLSSPRLRH